MPAMAVCLMTAWPKGQDGKTPGISCWHHVLSHSKLHQHTEQNVSIPSLSRLAAAASQEGGENGPDDKISFQAKGNAK